MLFRSPVLPGDLAPLGEHLHGPAGVVVIPDVGQQVLEPIDRIQAGVHGQDVIEANALFVAEVAPV